MDGRPNVHRGRERELASNRGDRRDRRDRREDKLTGEAGRYKGGGRWVGRE